MHTYWNLYSLLHNYHSYVTYVPMSLKFLYLFNCFFVSNTRETVFCIAVVCAVHRMHACEGHPVVFGIHRLCSQLHDPAEY